jgi:2-polyprenyl-6-methoxyphenol hydroxylase-like FAD-dependent oxidoreductase
MSGKILIAGGGIGGLTLAALLHRRGRECLVMERSPRFAPIGAGLVLQPNAVKALRIGGIEEAILSRGSKMERMQIRDDRGRVLSTVEAADFRDRFGSGVFGFHRATLHEALLALVPEASIRLGAAVRACGESSSGVFVELENGERIDGSALIAADGLRSAIRGQKIRDGEPLYSGYTSWRGVTSRGNLWPSGAMSESWGRGARFGLVAIDGDRLYWFATANVAAGGRDTGKGELLKRFTGWHAPIREVIEQTPDDAILRTDIADRDPVDRWSEGRVTLLGDAAHPMTPNLGQGGCQAIEDAVVLDLCLSATADIAAAFKDYETRRIERTARVVNEARRFGRIGQAEHKALRALRDAAVRLTPRAVTLRTVGWLYDFDI